MNSSTPKARVVAIVQARMGSTRLEGKTLADICGQPLLVRVIERVRASSLVDEVVVATTTAPEDRTLIDVAGQFGVRGYAGSVDDVLDRFYQVAKATRAEVIVRVTADDPFKDPSVLDEITRHLLEHSDLDYVSNTIEPTYPEGLDIEAFTFAALERAWLEARLPSEREHVTPYLWKNPEKFRTANVRHTSDLSSLRWTLDYEEDLRFAREVYERLHQRGIFRMDDILALLRAEPHLAAINKGIGRNAGYCASLEKDKLRGGA
jgi:spore coat polysaccharide biosynthesis protein SpsF